MYFIRAAPTGTHLPLTEHTGLLQSCPCAHQVRKRKTLYRRVSPNPPMAQALLSPIPTARGTSHPPPLVRSSAPTTGTRTGLCTHL